MDGALSKVRRALIRKRIRAALDRTGWSIAEDSVESVQTPFEKCRAKDKLSCKYHGAQYLYKILSQDLPNAWIGTYKTSDGGYTANIDVSAEEAKNAIGKTIEGIGYEITNAVDISDGQSQISIAKKEAPSDEIDNLSPDESMESDLEELDKFLEDNLTEEDEATLAEMEALLEEDALGVGEENEDTPLSECQAADPLTCPYHGVKALTNVVMGAFPGLSEANGDYEVDKADNGGFYIDIKATSDEVKQKIEPFLNSIGYEIKSAKDYDFDGTSLVKIGKKEIAEEKGGTVSLPAAQKPTEAKPKKGKGKGKSLKKVKESLEKAGYVGEKPEGILPPIAHDESKFPQGITQDELDAAIKNGKKAVGHGGLGTTIVEIDGKKYVCKSGSGKQASIIKNGYNADMAYRAGGVYAPDGKLYSFGDGKTYKLAEFIEGKRLIDVWKGADEETREKLRGELLKGYPLDVLFSNYDVLGTSPEESQSVTITGPDGKPMHTSVAFDNVIIGDDGHAYRIDNDGAFAMTGTGGVKQSKPGAFGGKVAYEIWDKWQDRQWIDDFRTLRRNPKNAGMFDRYSTADIFLSAGNIDLGHAVESLPEPLQKALAKPLHEMNQMTFRALNLDIGGYKNRELMSVALDSSYEAAKEGLRDYAAKQITWDDPGFGSPQTNSIYAAKPFPKAKPIPPKNPDESKSKMLQNSDYTGSSVSDIIIGAAKTINHHAGFVQKDASGNVLGNGTAQKKPDYTPNQSKIQAFERIDRDKLEELAKSDPNAKTLLDLYDSIADSKANGYKLPIGAVPKLPISASIPEGYKTEAEIKYEQDHAGVIKQYQEDLAKHKNEMQQYEAEKSEWDSREQAKAVASGKLPYKNFHDFVNKQLAKGLGTDGIKTHVGLDILPIEASMSSQKGASTGGDAVKNKVRELVMMGIPLEALAKLKDGDRRIYYGGLIAKKAKEYMSNPSAFKRDMLIHAMYKGMNMEKMENEISDSYDKASGTINVRRAISGDVTDSATGSKRSLKEGENPPHSESATDCCQFEANSWGGNAQYYNVPLSMVSYFHANDKASGGEYGYDGEQEIACNLIGLTPFVMGGSYKKAREASRKSKGIAAKLAEWAKRLGIFNTFLKKPGAA